MIPGAMDLLDILSEPRHDQWFFEDDIPDEEERQTLFRAGLTINKYMEKSETQLARSTLKRYFQELADVGYLKMISKQGHEYTYDLGKDSTIDAMGNVQLSNLDQKIMEFNYGSEITFTFEDEETFGVSLWDMHPEIEPPMWNKFLPSKL